MLKKNTVGVYIIFANIYRVYFLKSFAGNSKTLSTFNFTIKQITSNIYYYGNKI